MDKSKKNVALVLSSGSSRGLAHIGAIDALEERGYRITSVAGCSIGSLVGGMYAAGKLVELKGFFLEMTRQRMLKYTDFSVSLNHLIKGERLEGFFNEMIPNVRIENLSLPLSLIATDVTTGQEKVFREGVLSQLIRASISIPIVLRPVRYGDMLLMDGGVTNPLPLNRVQRNDGDLLVSVNVCAPIEPEKQVIKEVKSQKPHILETLLERRQRLTQMNYLSIINRITDIMVVQNVELMKQLYPTDMSVEIGKNHFGSYDYDRAEEIIAYGHELMMNEIERYEGLKRKSS